MLLRSRLSFANKPPTPVIENNILLISAVAGQNKVNALPANIQAGDLIILLSLNSQSSTQTPAGWNRVTFGVDLHGYDVNIFWRVYQPNDVIPYIEVLYGTLSLAVFRGASRISQAGSITDQNGAMQTSAPAMALATPANAVGLVWALDRGPASTHGGNEGYSRIMDGSGTYIHNSLWMKPGPFDPAATNPITRNSSTYTFQAAQFEIAP